MQCHAVEDTARNINRGALTADVNTAFVPALSIMLLTCGNTDNAFAAVVLINSIAMPATATGSNTADDVSSAAVTS